MGSEVIASRPRLPLLRHSHDPVPHVSRVPLLADRVGGGEFNMVGTIGLMLTHPNTHFQAEDCMYSDQRVYDGRNKLNIRAKSSFVIN